MKWVGVAERMRPSYAAGQTAGSLWSSTGGSKRTLTVRSSGIPGFPSSAVPISKSMLGAMAWERAVFALAHPKAIFILPDNEI
jgi:hypothetical protein